MKQDAKKLNSPKPIRNLLGAAKSWSVMPVLLAGLVVSMSALSCHKKEVVEVHSGSTGAVYDIRADQLDTVLIDSLDRMNTGLLNAVINKDVRKAGYYIDAGADVNLTREDLSLLALATTKDDAAMVRLLLKKGFNVEADAGLALSLAIAKKDSAIAGLLKQHGAKVIPFPGPPAQ
jgi:hypothetical protein